MSTFHYPVTSSFFCSWCRRRFHPEPELVCIGCEKRSNCHECQKEKEGVCKTCCPEPLPLHTYEIIDDLSTLNIEKAKISISTSLPKLSPLHDPREMKINVKENASELAHIVWHDSKHSVELHINKYNRMKSFIKGSDIPETKCSNERLTWDGAIVMEFRAFENVYHDYFEVVLKEKRLICGGCEYCNNNFTRDCLIDCDICTQWIDIDNKFYIPFLYTTTYDTDFNRRLMHGFECKVYANAICKDLCVINWKHEIYPTIAFGFDQSNPSNCSIAGDTIPRDAEMTINYSAYGNTLHHEFRWTSKTVPSFHFEISILNGEVEHPIQDPIKKPEMVEIRGIDGNSYRYRNINGYIRSCEFLPQKSNLIRYRSFIRDTEKETTIRWFSIFEEKKHEIKFSFVKGSFPMKVALRSTGLPDNLRLFWAEQNGVYMFEFVCDSDPKFNIFIKAKIRTD